MENQFEIFTLFVVVFFVAGYLWYSLLRYVRQRSK